MTLRPTVRRLLVALCLWPLACTAQFATPRAPLAVFAYDGEAPLDIREISSTGHDGFTVVDLTYASPAGGRVPALLYVPNGEGPFPGLLLMHGMPGSRHNASSRAEAYARRGVVVLAITAPFSRPDDVPRQAVISFTDQDRAEQIQLIQDLQRGVDLLTTHPQVDPARIGYAGGSYGGAMGGLLAGVETRIKAYALWVGDGGLLTHVTGPEDADGPFSRLPAEQQAAWRRAMEPIEPIRFVGDAAPAALYFQAGRLDRLVPAADAERYIAAGSEPKTVSWYDAGHGLNDAALRDQAAWLADQLGF